MLPNLTEFSLTSDSLTNHYDDQIQPLLRRMPNLKDLTLRLFMKRERFSDGIHLDKQVLIHMPKLSSFKFHICATISTSNTNQLLSDTDIQMTFIDWKYSSVNCCVYYLSNQLGVAHIYTTIVKNDTYYVCC
ncbi:unnamed protein product [Rotaria sp. Silwood1]|nr:unnamed protein product [Rotaria sp. Silwood1]CAF1610086.1 unnamed protein product [Rotaria sp. Silwood1]CAF3716164.1 unnamed protein product [Rotaria sp. Silwood1]CAF3809170.1 unnamed protein product [Rotaria sp. Silwood1]CAF4952250.1 unnamed protein product [Rotaria sp. Silwood1]